MGILEGPSGILEYYYIHESMNNTAITEAVVFERLMIRCFSKLLTPLTTDPLNLIQGTHVCSYPVKIQVMMSVI